MECQPWRHRANSVTTLIDVAASMVVWQFDLVVVFHPERRICQEEA